MVEVNQKAPDFQLPNSDGQTVTLSSFEGKSNVLLIMYPGDDTPGCTKQLCAVRDNYQDFADTNTTVLGINHANSESHKKFISKYGLKNPILVDEGRKVISEYGALGQFMGRANTKRTVVLIDKEGIIRWIERGLPSHEEIKKQINLLNN